MSTRKSARSAYAVARSRSWQDRVRQARNTIRQAGQFAHKVWTTPGRGPRWAIILAGAFVSLSILCLIIAVGMHKIIPALFAISSISFGINYLRGVGWWK